MDWRNNQMSTVLSKLREEEEEGGLDSPAKEKAASLGACGTRSPFIPWRIRNAIGVVKTKVLLCVVVLSVVFLLGPRSRSLLGWKLHQPSSVYSPSRGSYTVLINSWRPSSHLKQTVAHYASCSGTDAIHVMWSSSVPPPENLKSHLNSIEPSRSRSVHDPRVEFDINFERNFKSRFKPIGGLRTDAVFSVDDDVIVPCLSLEFAFAVWQSAPSNMVGFVPRLHTLDNLKNGAPYYKYEGWWSVWWRGTYSFVLAEAAFFHRKYLDMYTSEMPSSIYEYLSRERVCEDIAISLLVANATRSPPIWVKGKTYKIGSLSAGVLTGGGDSRNRCLNDLLSLYGTVPLVETSMKAVDARQQSWW